MTTTNGPKMWRGQVRVPVPMIEWVKDRAQRNFRSLNAEIVEVIREAMTNKEQKQ